MAASTAQARQSTGRCRRLTFPYYAPSTALPAPLPSIAEILAAKDVFPCIFHKRFIRRVGEHFIAKYGAISLDEAENMYFVAEKCGGGLSINASADVVRDGGAENNSNKIHNTMLVPKLYAAFHDTEMDANFIIMEYIPGKPLQMLWDDLGSAGRARVAQHLNAQFAALRSIVPGCEIGDGSNVKNHEHYNNNNNKKKNNGNYSSTGPYYGRLGRRPYNDIFLGSSTLPCGPFATEPQLNEAFYQRYASLHPDLAPGRGAFYRNRVFPQVLTGHPPVFTHGDLQAKNILVREADGLPVVIDWECAAWYPSYWEYTNALWTSRRWGDEWWVFVGDVLKGDGNKNRGDGGGGGEFVVEFKCLENLLGDLLDAPQPGV